MITPCRGHVLGLRPARTLGASRRCHMCLGNNGYLPGARHTAQQFFNLTGSSPTACGGNLPLPRSATSDLRHHRDLWPHHQAPTREGRCTGSRHEPEPHLPRGSPTIGRIVCKGQKTLLRPSSSCRDRALEVARFACSAPAADRLSSCSARTRRRLVGRRLAAHPWSRLAGTRAVLPSSEPRLGPFIPHRDRRSPHSY